MSTLHEIVVSLPAHVPGKNADQPTYAVQHVSTLSVVTSDIAWELRLARAIARVHAIRARKPVIFVQKR